MKNHSTLPMAVALSLAALLASCGGGNSQNIHVASVTLGQKAISMAVGDTRKLDAAIAPPNATNKKLSWISSNPGIARVDMGGTVTAVSAGAATIVVSSSDDGSKMDVCNLTVGSNVAGVSVEPGDLSLAQFSDGVLVARIEPDTAVNKKVTWMSYDTSVATVEQDEDNGLICLVTAKNGGSTTVIAITQDGGRMAQCSVRVEPGTKIDVTGVTLNKEGTVLGVGSAETLIATVWPLEATNRAVRWSSSNAGAATVSGLGAVTAVGAGSAVITAETLDGGYTAACEVTVASVYVAGFEYNPGVSVAKLWKNGSPQNLSAGASAAQANSVFVAGSVVYAAGHENNSESRPIAKLWVNDSSMNLTTGVNAAAANSVFVSGSSALYVAGSEKEAGVSVAKLWISGTPMSLSSGARNAEAKSLFVSDGNLHYVAGFEADAQGTDVARLWTNDPNQPQFLSDGSRDEQATSVHVSGGNVYVAGFERNGDGRTVAKLWINGSPMSLTDGRHNAKANGVFAAGDNTYYVVGSEYDPNADKTVAKLWTNDAAQAQTLSSGAANAVAHSVFVLGGNVYAVGSENNSYGRPTAKLWLNGAAQTLGNGIDNAAAYAVFLR
jgi:uncharacterized protein YjdB